MPERTVCLACIDGRIQIPVIKWIMKNHGSAYVDMITEPGIDGLLSDNNRDIGDIMDKIELSVRVNNASGIFIVGHHDCKGNPVEDSGHKDHILSGVNRIKKAFPGMDVKGLWVGAEWCVECLET